jgi:valyl-tRNA synthetase
MFPYPSGSGFRHWYNYSIMDSYCRYLSIKGEEVFQPFGFDSWFTRWNYAKVGEEMRMKNIDNFLDHRWNRC